MSDPFDISKSEKGVVRIFTTDMETEGSAAITPENVHRLLGDGLKLDAANVEVFPSTVIEEMSLSRYLQEGYGVPSDDIKGTAAALDALKGLIIVVSSRAFGGAATVLQPKNGIRFVGLFHEPSMAPPRKMDTPESSEGNLSPTGQSTPPQQRAGSTWTLALGALLLAAALVLFAVF